MLITDGVQGAYLAGSEGVWWHPAVETEVAGTAGAGDAFCSTLVAALAEGLPPEVAMRQAAVSAASVVSQVDTTDGLLRPAEMEAAVAALQGVGARRLD